MRSIVNAPSIKSRILYPDAVNLSYLPEKDTSNPNINFSLSGEHKKQKKLTIIAVTTMCLHCFSVPKQPVLVLEQPTDGRVRQRHIFCTNI